MKKIVSAVLCLMMFCICAAAEPICVEFGDTFSMTLPDDFEVAELSEDDISEGMIYCAANSHLEMYVWSFGLEGMTQQELYSMWQEDEFLQNVVSCEVGETAYLTYEIVDEGLGAVFSCENGEGFDFIFYCEDDEALNEAQGILDSITAL